jgi:DNA-binding LytR/AlgR family response regulator
LFLIDIDLKSDINGLELANIVRKHRKQAYIIFASGHVECVFESFVVKSFDFLVKPITTFRLEAVIINAYEDFKESMTIYSEQYLDIKSNLTIHRLKVKNLMYIEKSVKYVVFHSINSVIYSNMTLVEVEQLLHDKGCQHLIVRVHKSFFINNQFVKNINMGEKVLMLESGIEIPIGREYKHNLK